MARVLEALRVELTPIDFAIVAVILVWLAELGLAVHAQVAWREGYAAGAAGAIVKQLHHLEEATA